MLFKDIVIVTGSCFYCYLIVIILEIYFIIFTLSGKIPFLKCCALAMNRRNFNIIFIIICTMLLLMFYLPSLPLVLICWCMPDLSHAQSCTHIYFLFILSILLQTTLIRNDSSALNNSNLILPCNS